MPSREGDQFGAQFLQVFSANSLLWHDHDALIADWNEQSTQDRTHPTCVDVFVQVFNLVRHRQQPGIGHAQSHFGCAQA